MQRISGKTSLPQVHVDGQYRGVGAVARADSVCLSRRARVTRARRARAGLRGAVARERAARRPAALPGLWCVPLRRDEPVGVSVTAAARPPAPSPGPLRKVSFYNPAVFAMYKEEDDEEDAVPE
jgi:hypothetical protein